MGRQIISTNSQGLAASDASKSALGAIVVAGVVLLLFFAFNSAKLGNRAYDTASPAGVSAPAPAAT
jgi:hypothetical protein